MLIFLKQTTFCLFGSLVIFCTNTSGQSHLETKKWENIPFVTRSTGELHLDVFRPSDSKKRPAVLCLHGGFWAKGSKKFMHPLAEGLVEKGYVAVCSNYRLTDVAPAPAQLHDVFSAIRFLRENATDYGIDPEKIGVTGSSAGGYLAVMAAVFDSGDKRTRPDAAVGMGAQTDLTSPHIQNSTVLNWSKFMGGFYREVPQNYVKQSPINHLSSDDPPVAIICGEHDKSSTRANEFRKKAVRLGVATALTEISGAPHGLLKVTEHRRIAINALDNFLKAHLGKKDINPE
jgi:acetyl esterase/lipase